MFYVADGPLYDHTAYTEVYMMNKREIAIKLAEIFPPSSSSSLLLLTCLIVWQCKKEPEEALYKGGILRGQQIVSVHGSIVDSASNAAYFPAFIFYNLTQGFYCFSS